QKRQAFRNTTLRLIPPSSDRISIAYRFILGDAPSAKVKMDIGHKINLESQQYNDILVVPALDAYEHVSRKLYKSFQWTNNYVYDYLIKTDDDVFIRMDTIAQELEELGPGNRYCWRGLA